MMDTVTLPDRDKAITREDIEREIRLLENNASDCHVRTETVAMLRAILPHIGGVVTVKPLEWDGFSSGQYEIVITGGGMGHLYNYGNRDEAGEPEYMQGGFLSLISLDQFKEIAQKHHENQVSSFIALTPASEPDTGNTDAMTIAKYDDELRKSWNEAIEALKGETTND